MNKENLKPFNLEEFKAGKKALTEDERIAEYIGSKEGLNYPICAYVDGGFFAYTESGIYHAATPFDPHTDKAQWADVVLFSLSQGIAPFDNAFRNCCHDDECRMALAMEHVAIGLGWQEDK